MSGTTAEADAFLVTHDEPRARLERVGELIEGFETPYGMELLSSVHWVAMHSERVRGPADAVQAVHGWNDRKRRMFATAHIETAWLQLEPQGWLQPKGLQSKGA